MKVLKFGLNSKREHYLIVFSIIPSFVYLNHPKLILIALTKTGKYSSTMKGSQLFDIFYL